MAIKFAPVADRPKTGGRAPKPNPYLPVVKELDENRDKTLAATVSDAELKDLLNGLDRAGVALNVTVRRSVTKGDNGQHVVTLWVIDRITKKRKSED